MGRNQAPVPPSRQLQAALMTSPRGYDLQAHDQVATQGESIGQIHLVAMELAMVEILHFPIYTGSIGVLFVATFVVTVPAAWLLHRFTRVRPD